MLPSDSILKIDIIDALKSLWGSLAPWATYEQLFLHRTRARAAILSELIGGFYPVEEYLARYQKRSGLPVDPERVTYYRLFNFWRQVIITYASSHRCVLSRKTHQDCQAGMSAMVAGSVLQSLVDALREVV